MLVCGGRGHIHRSLPSFIAIINLLLIWFSFSHHHGCNNCWAEPKSAMVVSFFLELRYLRNWPSDPYEILQQIFSIVVLSLQVNTISNVDSIYRSTNFDGYSGTGFEIQEIRIHETATPVSDGQTHYNMETNSWGTKELLQVSYTE